MGVGAGSAWDISISCCEPKITLENQFIFVLNLCYLDLSKVISDMTLIHNQLEKKIVQLNLIKSYNFCSAKDTVRRVERQARDQE